jgi:hypothetical protein
VERAVTDVAAARIEIRALIDDYAYICDRRDHESYVALFTPDGEVTITNAGDSEPSFRAKGVEELRDVLKVDDQFARLFHAVANHRVAIDGDSAAGITYTTIHHYIDDPANPRAEVMLSRLNDRYVWSHDGWKFSSRRIELQWSESVLASLQPFEEEPCPRR